MNFLKKGTLTLSQITRVIRQFGKQFSKQFGKDFGAIPICNHVSSVTGVLKAEVGSIQFYSSMSAENISYDPYTGRLSSHRSDQAGRLNIRPIFEDIRACKDANIRAVFCMGEKKYNEPFGHVVTVVVDKKQDEVPQITVIDSKPEHSVFMWLWNHISSRIWALCHFNFQDAIFGYQYTHCDHTLRSEVLNDVYGDRYSYNRIYHGHQAAILNNDCGLFVTKTITELAEYDANKSVEEFVREKITPRWSWSPFTSSKTFLSQADIETCRGLCESLIKTQ